VANDPTPKQRAHWEKVRELGCIVGPAIGCEGDIEIHHCLTGAGGRKNHNSIVPLCYGHHRGREGIHTISRRVWQNKYGHEVILMVKVQDRLDVERSKNVVIC